MLSFQLLGSVSLFKNGQPLSQFRSQKEAALLIYLAQTGQTHTRAFIAALLWEDRSSQQAFSNLRTVLARLRNQVGDALVITRKSLALAPASRQQVDALLLLQAISTVKEINSSASAKALQTALDAYQGDFLADFTLADAPHFDEWVTVTREQIRRQVVAAYSKLGQYALATKDGEWGITVAHRWLQVDLLDEAAHMLLIQLLLAAGEVREAVIHYDRCADLLRTELGIAPSDELKALIQDGWLQRTSAIDQTAVPHVAIAATEHHTGMALRHNIPPFYDQFIDREAIQQELHTRLDQPWCRLVTIVGLGGVGKTRLATAIARSRLNRYADGVWFVELAEVDPNDDNVAEAIVIEIATAVDLRLSGAQTPTEQLLSHLQHKETLLVLDNFEHLLAGVQIVLDLLQRCEKTQLIVTSREALQIRAEWMVALGGLSYPASDDDERPTDAVKLFMARQLQRGRSASTTEHAAADADDATAIRTICRLVEGLPLAIELAAGLTSHTAPRAIAATLHDGFDALTTPLRDIPQRHRGLPIVFEISWRTLTPALQQRLAHLAVFRSGFTRAAAAQIADVDATHLAALSAKSLLTYTPAADRYTLHAVIQAYAATKRSSHPSTNSGGEATLQNHAHYYLTMLAEQREVLQKGAPQVAVTLLQPDIDNVRLAWQTALAAQHPHPASPNLGEEHNSRRRDNSPLPSLGRVRDGSYADLLLDALPSLSIYYQLRGLAREGEAVMQTTAKTATTWERTGLALATRAGLEQARFQNRLGRYRLAIETVEAALRSAQRGADRWAEGMGHVLWGEALWRMGEYDEAQGKLKHALTIARAIDSTLLVGWCHHHLGVIDDIQSRYAAAHDHLQQACAAWRTLDNARTLSNSLNSIGLVCLHQGNLPAAQQAMEEALTLCNQLDNRHLQSILLNNLGIVATEQGDYNSAQYYLQAALALAITSGNLTSQGEIYSNLGKNYSLLGKTELALKSLAQGVQISESIGNRALLASTLLSLAEITDKQGESKRAEAFYRQVLEIARQAHLKLIECEVLIAMAGFLRQNNESEISQYSARAVMLAETLQNPVLLERATAINQT